MTHGVRHEAGSRCEVNRQLQGAVKKGRPGPGSHPGSIFRSIDECENVRARCHIDCGEYA